LALQTLSVFDVRASERFVGAFVSDDGDVLGESHVTSDAYDSRAPRYLWIGACWLGDIFNRYRECWRL
jgi:hypothetical protein